VTLSLRYLELVERTEDLGSILGTGREILFDASQTEVFWTEDEELQVLLGPARTELSRTEDEELQVLLNPAQTEFSRTEKVLELQVLVDEEPRELLASSLTF
jgi:hypothetical protein